MIKKIIFLILFFNIHLVFAGPVNFLLCKESVEASMVSKSTNYSNIAQNFRDFIKNTSTNDSGVIYISRILLTDAEFVADAYNQISAMINIYGANKIEGIKNRDSAMSFIQPNFFLIRQKSKNIGEFLETVRDKSLFREAMQLKTEFDKDLELFKSCYP